MYQIAPTSYSTESECRSSSSGTCSARPANLPDGRRGWYAYWRVGGEPLSVAAFRVMNIVTAA